MSPSPSHARLLCSRKLGMSLGARILFDVLDSQDDYSWKQALPLSNSASELRRSESARHPQRGVLGSPNFKNQTQHGRLKRGLQRYRARRPLQSSACQNLQRCSSSCAAQFRRSHWPVARTRLARLPALHGAVCSGCRLRPCCIPKRAN